MTDLSPQIEALVLAIGLVLALGCYVLSNLSPGGMITPAWIALGLVETPRLAAVMLAVILVTYFAARAVGTVVILYGKRLFASVLMLGVFFSTTAFLLLSTQLPALTETGALGFVAPGLVAYQLIRQPLVPTLLATAGVTSLICGLLAAGIALGAIPPATSGAAVAEIPSFSIDTIASRYLLLALAVCVAGALLARADLQRLAALVRPVQPALAFAGLAGPRATRHAGPAAAATCRRDAVTLAELATALPAEEWRRLVLHLGDHAARAGFGDAR